MRKSASRVIATRVLGCTLAFCSAVGFAAPATKSAQEWLSELPPLPKTAESAYGQWTDVSGNLTPNPASEQLAADIKAEVLSLERPVAKPNASPRRASPQDQAAIERITVFPDTASAQRKIEAALAQQSALLQQWRAELSALEQRRLLARGALPACHNEAGSPSQASIREVEESFSQQKIAIAAHYLGQVQPLLDQLVSAVTPRIAFGDAALNAWEKLRHSAKKTELEPVARGVESDALLDVALIQSFIQEPSKLAARAIAERTALRRVYANAKSC